MSPKDKEPDDKDNTDQIVLDAEQFKAKVQSPKGRSFNFERFMQNIDDNDEFFHVMWMKT